MIVLKEMTRQELHLFMDVEAACITQNFVPEVLDNSQQPAQSIGLLPKNAKLTKLKTYQNSQFFSIFDHKQAQAKGGVLIEIIQHRAFIIQLLIYPQFRNQKLAQKTLIYLENLLLNQGVYLVTLNVFASNKAALHLFSKLNYEVKSISHCNYYMEKELM